MAASCYSASFAILTRFEYLHKARMRRRYSVYRFAISSQSVPFTAQRSAGAEQPDLPP